MTSTEAVRKPRRKRYPPERDVLWLRNIGMPGWAIRLVLVIVALWVGMACFGWPLWGSFAAEANCSKALSKGKVLLRGAQIVATQQLIANNDWEQAAGYLSDGKNLIEIMKASKFPVEAIEIREAELDNDGLLTDFVCIVDYKKQRYKLTFDITENIAKAFLVPPAQE